MDIIDTWSKLEDMVRELRIRVDQLQTENARLRLELEEARQFITRVDKSPPRYVEKGEQS